jgi:UDP-3-O-acyl-N-acetylglucosamine deacetylase
MSALDKQVSGDHYKDLKIQPIEYIHANGIPFAEGSVIKYVSRWRAKGGIKDLEKAKHFLELLIELEVQAAAPEIALASDVRGE